MTSKAKKVETTAETLNAVNATKQQEDTYNVEEFVKSSELVFGVKPFVVRAALEADKLYTVDEAKKIVKEFDEREVK